MAEEPQKLHAASYALYYLVLFFAYWFGSNRFDHDGDGDFDPEDVEAYLADKGLLSKNFRQTQTKRRKLRKQKAKQQRQDSGTPSATSQDSRGDGTAEADDAGDGIEEMLEAKVTGVAVEDEIVANLVDRQIKPWFVIIECVLCLGLWFVMSLVEASNNGLDPLQLKAGLDSFQSGSTDLRLSTDCKDQRFEAWRWWTYQYTHVGAMHVLMNVFLTVMLGIPLEGLHGCWRMAFMFNVGVFGGACCYFVNDAHTVVVGCSGGCYALIGMHIADLFMNWKQKKFRWPCLLFLLLMVSVDIFSYTMSLSAENTSHTAHVGGAIAGVIIGILVGKNLKVKLFEQILMGIVAVIGTLMVAFCIVWLVMNQAPLNIWEASAGETGYCWIRQIYNSTINLTSWLCVRCADNKCIQYWTPMGAQLVSTLACEAQGFHNVPGGR